MGSEWNTGRLGDYLDSCLGKMLDQKKNKGELHPYLGNKSVRWGSFDLDHLADMPFEDHEHEKYGLKYGDLIICEGGEPGRCSIWKDQVSNMKIQKALHRVRPKDKLDNFYLYYWFLWAGKNDRLEQYFTGTTIKHLTGKALATIELPIPPLPIQKGIAGLLCSLDNKIQLNRQTNQTLEQMAQALFKSWFVDFDPVIDNALAAGNPIPPELEQRAQQRAQQQTQAGASKAPKANAEAHSAALPQHLRDLFPSEFEYTEALGWVPKGWKAGSLMESVSLVGGGTPKTTIDEYWGGHIPWFSVVDAPNDSDIYVINTVKHVTQSGVDNSSTKILRAGTTIISARGTVGKCALVAQPMTMNQSCYGVQGKKGFPDEYVYFLIRYRVSDLQLRGHGSVFNTITGDTFESINSPQPTDKVMDEFSNLVKPMFKKVLANGKQIAELSKLRDTLLPKLISGELRLPEVETDTQSLIHEAIA